MIGSVLVFTARFKSPAELFEDPLPSFLFKEAVELIVSSTCSEDMVISIERIVFLAWYQDF